jgi:hypothetical protein
MLKYVIKPIFLTGKWKKSSSSKLHWTTKIAIVYLIKNSSLFYFLPKKWWSCDCFSFPASEAPNNFWGPQKRLTFWILDPKVCLKKLGIGSGWYGKSVLYLMYLHYLCKLYSLFIHFSLYSRNVPTYCSNQIYLVTFMCTTDDSSFIFTKKYKCFFISLTLR